MHSRSHMSTASSNMSTALYKHKLVLKGKKTKFMLLSRSSNIDFNTVNTATQDPALSASQSISTLAYGYTTVVLFYAILISSQALRQKLWFLYQHKMCFLMHTRKRIVEATLMSTLDYEGNLCVPLSVFCILPTVPKFLELVLYKYPLMPKWNSWNLSWRKTAHSWIN